MKWDSPAKCILSGEHAVLRGGQAIALPIQSLYLSLSITPSDKMQVQFLGDKGEEVKIPFWMAMEKALDMVGKTRADLKANFIIDSHIPVGSGLGASASFCVAIAKAMIFFGWLDETQDFEFSKSLEDIFHGESSGLDIAVSLKKECILFTRNKPIETYQLGWQPNLYLSYSGHRGLTADCIRKVKDLWIKDKDYAASIDTKMQASVEKFKRALSSDKDIYLVKEALDIGLSCFQDWNLVSANLREHMQELRNQGALAMKPTGSGDGGYVLSLWPEGSAPTDKTSIKVF